jgi:hypothetical protein
VTTGTADGRLGRADAGHYERVERDLSSAKAPGAHRDFNRTRSDSGEALVDAGHGDVLAVALGRSWGRNGSGGSYGRIERVFGGAIGGGAHGGAAGVLRWLGTAASEANWRGAGSSSASGFKKRKRGLWPLGALSPQRKAVRG